LNAIVMPGPVSLAVTVSTSFSYYMWDPRESVSVIGIFQVESVGNKHASTSVPPSNNDNSFRWLNRPAWPSGIVLRHTPVAVLTTVTASLSVYSTLWLTCALRRLLVISSGRQSCSSADPQCSVIPQSRGRALSAAAEAFSNIR
jgi:hypothetical protein